LESQGMVLVKSTRAPEASPSRPHFTSDSSAFGREVPVYDLNGVDVVLTNQILVKPRPSQAGTVKENLSRLGELNSLGHGSYLLTIDRNKSTLDVSNSLARSAEIEYAEPNFITLIQPGPKVVPKTPGASSSSAMNVFPSDQYFPQQWALENRGAGNTKKGADIRVQAAWKVADGHDVVIAILDEGVDLNHPDLKDKIVNPYDSVTNAQGQSEQPNAWDGHGTACAGIAAAITDNSLGVAGVGYKAKIMPIRIASKEASGEDWVTTTEIIARGIDWAVDHNADVVSNSWGGGDPDPYIEDAIKRGLTNGRKGLGAVFVFAAGNHGTGVEWPANLAKSLPVIAVSATNEWDEFKTFTSRDGENWWASNFGDEITVAAPGVHIMTTDISGDGGYVKGDYFSGFNGTSAATPHVAGVAALILSSPQWTTLKASEVKQRLQQTADPLGPKEQFGAGRVNACKAVSAAGC
jgi:subtilisin family serine protease